MQLSHYLKIYPCEDGRRLLFSTRQASKVLLKEETLRALEGAGLSAEDEALLARLGMLVPDREAERQECLERLERLNARDACLRFTVVLNLDCNFGCIYCYEGDMKGRLYMSPETAADLVTFVAERFTDQKKFLLLDFYGGEPLLSLGLIRSISGRLKPLVEDRGGVYQFTLVTNGSLLTRQVAADLAPLGLERVRITLDGPAENHDRYRPFKSGAGSFETIIGNIKETWDLVKIGIGGNFDRGNYTLFPRLLDYLGEVGLTPDKIPAVKFDPVTNRSEGEMTPADYGLGCMSVNEPWLFEAGNLLREEILRRGYRTLRITPTHCMIELTDAYVVNYDGTIYKCPGFIGREGFAVGSLRKGIEEDQACYGPGIWKNEECARCEYLPLCFGGCRYMTYLRNGTIDQVDCKRAYLDATLETLVKQDIAYGSNGR